MSFGPAFSSLDWHHIKAGPNFSSEDSKEAFARAEAFGSFHKDLNELSTKYRI